MSSSPNTSNLQVNSSHKQILSIALPISASILVPQINFITNNIFLGGLGQEALGLAGITGVFYLIFAVIGHGLNNGLQSLISRRLIFTRHPNCNCFFVIWHFIDLACGTRLV
jgi:Na+-driven multidrug efflux pump